MEHRRYNQPQTRFSLFTPKRGSSHMTQRRREMDSNLYGDFPVKWCFRFIASSLFGAGRAVLRPVACDQVPGARGRGQGTETLAKLGGLPLSDACVSQRLDA